MRDLTIYQDSFKANIHLSFLDIRAVPTQKLLASFHSYHVIKKPSMETKPSNTETATVGHLLSIPNPRLSSHSRSPVLIQKSTARARLERREPGTGGIGVASRWRPGACSDVVGAWRCGRAQQWVSACSCNPACFLVLYAMIP